MRSLTTICKLPLVATVLLACSHDASVSPLVDPPTSPPPAHKADTANGRVAFAASCASCHASGDGWDLAFFDFGESDVIRRASRHVSAETAVDIAGYIQSLRVPPRDRSFRPFQPMNAALASDGEFWTEAFGAPANTWPADLTPEHLRRLSFRNVRLPFALPPWSLEVSNNDWMPDVALPAEVLRARGDTLQKILDAYYRSPSDDVLRLFVAVFRDIVNASAENGAPLCGGFPGFQPRFTECFDALRWASTLTAAHFLRRGITENIPADVLDLWWDTGKAAVTESLRGHSATTIQEHQEILKRTAGWLTLAFSYAPMRFTDAGADYLGQFLQQAGFSHFATAVYLHRMTSDGPANTPETSGNRILEGSAAVFRAPNSLKYHTALFVLDYLIGRMDAGAHYDASRRTDIERNLAFSFDVGISFASPADAAIRDRYVARRAEFDAKLASAFVP